MKKLIMSLLVSLFLVAGSGTAHAVILDIGGLAVPTGASSPGGTLLTSITLPFLGVFNEIEGSVTQNVLQNPTGILFEYLITSTGNGSITQATASFFQNYTTNVDGPIAPYTPNVDLVTRGVDGSTVTWSYIDDAILFGGESSTLWVQTDAPSYAAGGFSLIGADTVTLDVYGPTGSAAVPEPATMGLLGMGLIGMVSKKLRKKIAA
jgi:hypothetical protein